MPIYTLQHQFLTDTPNIQTVQFGNVEGATEQYLFAMNNEMIRTVANANFFAVPTSDDDSNNRTATVNLPLRYNRNSTTKKYDSYASQQPFAQIDGNGEFDGAKDNSSYVHKLCAYIRPDYLRIGWKGCDRAIDIGQLDFSILPAIDVQHEMLEWRKINVCEKLRRMYRGVVLSSPLDLFAVTSPFCADLWSGGWSDCQYCKACEK